MGIQELRKHYSWPHMPVLAHTQPQVKHSGWNNSKVNGMLTPGRYVCISGLVVRPEFNGKVGILLCINGDRWDVLVGSSLKKILPENLVLHLDGRKNCQPMRLLEPEKKFLD